MIACHEACCTLQVETLVRGFRSKQAGGTALSRLSMIERCAAHLEVSRSARPRGVRDRWTHRPHPLPHPPPSPTTLTYRPHPPPSPTAITHTAITHRHHPPPSPSASPSACR